MAQQVPPEGIDAYNALNESDRDAVDMVVLNSFLSSVRMAEENPAGAITQDFANNLTFHAFEAHLAATPDPSATARSEQQIEIRRAVLAEAPRLQGARATYAQFQQQLASQGINLEPHSATRILDRMIAIDGDQFDIRAQWPAIRAAVIQEERAFSGNSF